MFLDIVGEFHLQEAYWTHFSKAMILMYNTAKIFSDMEHNVIIDGMLLDLPKLHNHYKTLKNLLKNNPLKLVEVYYPIEICRKRNLDRSDRYKEQFDNQIKLVAKNIDYDIKLDTCKYTSEVSANIIMKKFY